MIAPPKPPSHDELDALIKEARERQWRRRLLGAAGVAILTAIGLAINSLVTGGNPGNLVHRQANAGKAIGPLCRASQLSASTFLEGATGSMAGEAAVTNTSGAVCSLPLGRPTVAIAWQGKPMPVREQPLSHSSGRPSLFHQTLARVLAPGGNASIYMEWRNWCGRPQTNGLIRPTFQLRFGDRLTVAAPTTRPGLTPPYCNATVGDLAASTLYVSPPMTPQ